MRAIALIMNYLLASGERYLIGRGQTNRGYKNTNPDTGIHLLIFISHKTNQIFDRYLDWSDPD